jgi:hypothetical protein
MNGEVNYGLDRQFRFYVGYLQDLVDHCERVRFPTTSSLGSSKEMALQVSMEANWRSCPSA